MRKLLLFLFALFAVMQVQAYDALIDGIFYNLNASTHEAEVSSTSYNSYSGAVIIPSTVTYSDVTYNVTTIGYPAFQSCRFLTSVTIPSSITSIKMADDGYDGIFGGCTALETVIVDVDNPVFDSRDGCNAIIETANKKLIAGCKTTEIPNTVTSIGQHAFDYCTELTTITIPSSVTSVEYAAFRECSGLTSVNITNIAAWCNIEFKSDNSNPLTYAHNLYLNGDKVTALVIPTGVTSIGNYAFNACTALTSIEIPSSLTMIGSSAFSGCSGMTAVYITDLASWCNISFGSNPLNYAHTLYLNGEKVTTLVIPDGVEKISNYAFNCCSALTSVEIAGSVTTIGTSAFSQCTELTSATISNGVTTIEGGAFSSCTKLASVNMPNSVITIGSQAFYGCPLTSVTIPSSAININGQAFEACSCLTSIVVDVDNPVYDSRENCNAIIESASNTLLRGCKYTIIPDGITTIGNYAFNYCTGLTTITIPDGMLNIGSSAFYNCTDLSAIAIPNGVTTIGSTAFAHCTNLSTMEIPNSVNDIGQGAFSETGWLKNQVDGLIYAGMVAYEYKGTMPENTSVVLKEGTTGIAGSCFSGCTDLVSITIPEGVVTVGEFAFQNCSNFYFRSISLPNSIRFIGRAAFQNCYYLGTVNIPKGVKTIESSTFYNCRSLSSITIPQSITSIGNAAFYGCKELTSVVAKMKTPCQIRSNVYIGTFRNVHASCVLTIPYGTTEAYIAAGWTTDVFKGGIVEASQEDVSVTIGSAGIATYCYDHDLDFSDVEGLSAYIVSGFSPSTGKLTLTPVTEVPAGEGLLLKGAEGSYDVPFTTTDMYYSNLLQGVTTATEISPTDGDQTNFILANGKHGIGFYTLSGTGELAAGKAYLHLPTSAVEAMEARCFTLDFENDEATGIMEHEMKVDEDVYFDMQGRRLLRPSSGIYIVNGKKVIIK